MSMRWLARRGLPLATLATLLFGAIPVYAAKKVESRGFVDATRYTDLVDEYALPNPWASTINERGSGQGVLDFVD